jgi:hypothetical protein
VSQDHPLSHRAGKGAWGRLAELGPAWITALAALIVALTGAGFFAGRVSAPSSPAVKSTNATTPTSAAVSPISSVAPTTSGGSVDTGEKLADYSFVLPNGYSAPLGTSTPTQSQIVQGSVGTFDVFENADMVSTESGGGEKLVTLPVNSTPTYSSCASNTDFVSSFNPIQGDAFCVIEPAGRIAGIAISSVTSSPFSMTLNVTIWRNAS